MSNHEIIHIKNMVCRRCVDTVYDVAKRFNLPVLNVQIGQARFIRVLEPKQKVTFKNALEKHGFEILTSRQTRIVEGMKQLILKRVRHPDIESEYTLSAYLSLKLNYDYSHLSKLFSSIEGITIERHFVLQRLERTKELLAYNELTITQIAEETGFSNAAHLASSFKKETGMRPSEFRKQTETSRTIP